MLTSPTGAPLSLDALPWPSEEMCQAFVDRCMAGPSSWRFWTFLFLRAQEDPSALSLMERLLEGPLFALVSPLEWEFLPLEEKVLRRLEDVLGEEELLALAESLLPLPPASLSPALLDAYVEGYSEYRGMPPSWWLPLLQAQKGSPSW